MERPDAIQGAGREPLASNRAREGKRKTLLAEARWPKMRKRNRNDWAALRVQIARDRGDKVAEIVAFSD